MLNASISIGDLLWAILFILATGIGVMLIITLVKLINILKKVNDIVSDNKENINELLTVLPETISSINEGVQSVKRTVDNAGDTIGIITDSVAPRAGGFLESADGIIDLVKIIGEVVRAAVQYFKKTDE